MDNYGTTIDGQIVTVNKLCQLLRRDKILLEQLPLPFRMENHRKTILDRRPSRKHNITQTDCNATITRTLKSNHRSKHTLSRIIEPIPGKHLTILTVLVANKITEIYSFLQGNSSFTVHLKTMAIQRLWYIEVISSILSSDPKRRDFRFRNLGKQDSVTIAHKCHGENTNTFSTPFSEVRLTSRKYGHPQQ